VKLREWQERFSSEMQGLGTGGGELFAPAEGPSPAARFSVYRKGHWLRVSRALRADFPLTARLLGDAAFEAMAREFLGTRRGHELELSGVSPKFADFLLASAGSRGLRRSVRLDLLALEAEQAPDPESCEAGGYGLHPSVRISACEGRAYVLWRREGIVRRERVDEATQRLLECFRGTASLEELSLRLEEMGAEAELVQAGVARWTGLGVIVRA
jgi:hypothetical protein